MPAFRRPQATNAATTLAIMGVMAITMFIGISWLTVHIHGRSQRRPVDPGADRVGVFHGGLGFYVVQFFTATILILAANTAYQDFPRLSSILARDRYMPSQFRNRGDRLVFSNGIVVLAIGSSLLIYAFEADLTRTAPREGSGSATGEPTYAESAYSTPRVFHRFLPILG